MSKEGFTHVGKLLPFPLIMKFFTRNVGWMYNHVHSFQSCVSIFSRKYKLKKQLCKVDPTSKKVLACFHRILSVSRVIS